MASLQFVTTLWGAGYAYLESLQSLTIHVGAGGPELHTASGALGGTTRFALASGSVAQMAGQAAYQTISRSYAQLPDAAGPVLIAQVRLQDVLDQALVGGPGAGIPIFARNSGFVGDQVTMIAVTMPGGTFVYAGSYGAGGITGYRVTTAATATMPTVLAANGGQADAVQTHLSDISALASARLGGDMFLFTASASEHGIDSFRIDDSGALTLADTVDAQESLYVSGLSALQATTVGGEWFMLATASGSSSLSVLRLAAGGQMQLVDHVMDSQDTRFAGASALAVVTAGERTYAVVAGSDDGITLFTLLPGGRLYQLGSYADTGATSLMNVSGLAAAVVGSEIQIFASSGAEGGITQFRIDLSRQGQTLMAATTPIALAGGGLDDVIVGNKGNDTLGGGDGNDLILDGAGSDQLYGGAGDDVFVMAYDTEFDRVLDFQPGADRLDLSAWPMLYGVAQLLISTTATGAILTFGNERLELVTATQTPLTLAQLATPDILNLMRQFGLLDGPGLMINGTSASDLMIGAAGKDRFNGTAGGDWMCGGGGVDTASYALSASPIVLDLRNDSRNKGDAAGDTYESIEKFEGTGGHDKISGATGADQFFGGLGRDQLYGRGNDDLLSGQRGRDKMAGGKGADILTGGQGADYFLFRKSEESLARANGADTITDFQPGTDHIALWRIDANASLAGDQSFTFRGFGAFGGTEGEVRVIADDVRVRTLVELDLNGDKQADMRIVLEGLITLGVGDFLL